MYKRFLLAVAFILISAALASAQTTGQTFERYNRWMVGGELIKRYNEDFGWGGQPESMDDSSLRLYFLVSA